MSSYAFGWRWVLPDSPRLSAASSLAPLQPRSDVWSVISSGWHDQFFFLGEKRHGACVVNADYHR
jgi:hypothetical protein